MTNKLIDCLTFAVGLAEGVGVVGVDVVGLDVYGSVVEQVRTMRERQIKK